MGYGKEQDKELARLKETVLAQQSLLLLLVLVNHCTTDKAVSNPYQKALFSFVNSQGVLALSLKDGHFINFQSSIQQYKHWGGGGG